MGLGFIPPTVITGFRAPNVGLATKYDPGGMEVSPPVTVGSITTFTIDATLTNSLTYVLPYVDPAGCVITGFPWTSPQLVFEFTTPPTASSGVALLVGMQDGTAPATDQWVAVGDLYNAPAGPRPQSDAHDVGPFTSATVAGGAVISAELATNVSTAVVGSTITRADGMVAADKLGGSGASVAITVSDDYAKVPHLIIRITATSASAETAMVFAGRFSYAAPFKQTQLGV